MTFISYAQNFEDVMLWRVLKDVHSGFYIDIGANDPVIDSVSYAFYQRGWRGIHVEPIPVYAEKIRAARPDETVIEAAVNDVPGAVVLFDIANTGMSTGRENIATQHLESGFASQRITVPTITLAEVFEAAKSKEIHWLKIDIEGMEEAALRSWGVSAARPWVVVVESILPNSPETNFNDWESHLLARGYQFVYFDGLNRFYLHNFRHELRSRFDAPPNILDNFILTEYSGFARELAEKIAARTSEAAQASAKMEALLSSRSWRMTAPIRWLSASCRHLISHKSQTRTDVP